MSDTSGLPNTDSEGVPAEDRPERFEEGAQQNPTGDGAQGAQVGRETGDQAGGDDSGDTGGAASTESAGDTDTDAPEPPPAEFDPAQQPSNPDLVKNVEPPD